MDRHQLRVAASARIKERDHTRVPEQTDTLTTPTLIIYRPKPELKPVSRSTQVNLRRLRRSGPGALLGLLSFAAAGIAVVQSSVVIHGVGAAAAAIRALTSGI